MLQVKLTSEALAAIEHGVTELQAIDDTGHVCGYIISPEYRAKVHGWLTELFGASTSALPQGGPHSYSTSEAIAYLRGLEAGLKHSA